MKYDPESPAMTDSCVERHRSATQCLLFPGLDLLRWGLWWHEPFYQSFRRLGEKQKPFRCGRMQRIWRLSFLVNSAFFLSTAVFSFLHSSIALQLQPLMLRLDYFHFRIRHFYKMPYLDFQSVQILSLFLLLTPSPLLPSVIAILSRKHTLLL